MRRWRDQSRPRRRKIWGALHPVHNVDLFDRGCGGKHNRTVLVSAIHNAGHGICVTSDPAGEGRELFGLVITLDLQILGQRHKDLKNGLSAPPKPTLKNMINLSTKWGWGLEMLKTKRRFFGNIVGHVDDVSDPASLMDWTAQQFDPTLDWDKIKQIKDEWGGKVILKGILDAEDAKMALNVVRMRLSCQTTADVNWMEH